MNQVNNKKSLIDLNNKTDMLQIQKSLYLVNIDYRLQAVLTISSLLNDFIQGVELTGVYENITQLINKVLVSNQVSVFFIILQYVLLVEIMISRQFYILHFINHNHNK